jgi:uncharacterized membrane protein
MAQEIIQALHGFPVHLTVVIIAMLPILELRGSIPWAIAVAGLSWQEAYALSILGNMIPIVPILLLLGPVSERLRRWRFWDTVFTWLFNRTRRRSRLVERYESFGLFLLVAIPLPMTGAWTGALAAFLFGIRIRYSLPVIFLGVLAAGVVVTCASLGLIKAWFFIGTELR